MSATSSGASHRPVRNSLAAIAIACALCSARSDAQTLTWVGVSTIASQKRAARDPLPARADLSEASKLVVAATNAFRQTEKLAAVEPNPQLLKAARYYADFMARTEKYGHHADGSAPADRATKFGYDYCIISENVAYQFSSVGFSTQQLAQRLFDGWKNSPEHRKNMLDPNVTDTAIAVAHSANTGHYYSVQLFGRPKSQTIQFSVANHAGVAVEYAVGDQTFPLPPRATRTHRVCRQPVVNWRGTAVEPRSGQTLLITSDDGALQLKTQQ